MFLQLLKKPGGPATSGRVRRRWAKRTLVVGPIQPVDGDSVASTKALIQHLRKQGREAFTLPTVAMYKQLEWILESGDYHPASLQSATERFTTDDLQRAYDAMLSVWQPDEIVLVDGPRHLLGFDPRGVKVFNIDHHVDHGTRDDGEAYIQPAPSAGCLLVERYRIFEPVLAISILTDTYWLRQNLPAQAARCLGTLSRHGLTDQLLTEMQRKLFVRKDLRVLSALHDADIQFHDHCVFVVLHETDPEIHRGVMGELNYFHENICCVRADGYVSFRTADPRVDLRPLADKWKGGGHKHMAATRLPELNSQVLEELHNDFVDATKCCTA